MLSLNQDLINKIGTKLERVRDVLQSETSSVRDTINAKVDVNDKYYNEQLNEIEKMIRSDKSDVKTEINKTYEMINMRTTAEVDKLKETVTKVISEAQAHRENLQEKYDEKLNQIKDVCS